MSSPIYIKVSLWYPNSPQRFSTNTEKVQDFAVPEVLLATYLFSPPGHILVSPYFHIARGPAWVPFLVGTIQVSLSGLSLGTIQVSLSGPSLCLFLHVSSSGLITASEQRWPRDAPRSLPVHRQIHQSRSPGSL